MRVIMYGVLLFLEYGLAKIAWLIMTSLVVSGIAPYIGGFIFFLLVVIMIRLWIWGSAEIRG